MSKLLIVEDDPLFSSLMADELMQQGFSVITAHDHQSAIELMRPTDLQLTHCLLDLGLPSGSGLSLIAPLVEQHPFIKIVVLTGFANVPTAVEAIKLGALYYLSKPVDVEQVMKAFERESGDPATPLDTPSDLDTREREHVLAVLQRNQFNISISAKELGMHRRTLQRKIVKWGLRD